MCLAALALDLSPRFPFVLAANRDEFFGRPTAALDWWSPGDDDAAPQILGGRDLRAGGTWLGLVGEGRLALVTNVRETVRSDPAAPSRGAIVPDWITGSSSFEDLALVLTGRGYAGVNVVAVDAVAGSAFYASNRAPNQRIDPGAVHAVSNAALDTPWPKVRRLKERMGGVIRDATGHASTDELIRSLFVALADESLADDAELPATGVPLALERQLSAAFIRTPDGAYGTRCSTVIVVDGDALHVHERTFPITLPHAQDDRSDDTRRERLALDAFPAWAMGRPRR